MYNILPPASRPSLCARQNSMEGLSANELLELKCETKFNVLLLLRNRYPEGLETNLVQEKYQKFFDKEINILIFNPDARNILLDNRDFLGDDISVYRNSQKIYFKAKSGCSDEAMQFLSNSVSSRKDVETDYIEINSLKSNLPIPHNYADEDSGNYSLHMFTQEADYGEEVEEVDPLEQKFADTENFCTSIVTDMEELAHEFPIAYQDPNTAFTDSNSCDSLHYIISTEDDEDNGANTVDTNNSATYLLVDDVGYPENQSNIVCSNISKRISRPNPKYVHTEEIHTASRIRPSKLEKCRSSPNKGCKRNVYSKVSFQKNSHTRNGQKNRYKCKWDKCEKTFSAEGCLRRHIENYHDKKQLKCSVTKKCSHTCRSLDRMLIHEARCRFKHDTYKEMELENNEQTHQDESESEST